MNVFLTAQMKHNPEEFFAKFQPGDEQKLSYGESLLLCALGNADAHTRYTIAEFLISRDCLVGPPGPAGHTGLHALFGQHNRDLDKDLQIARWLIDHGTNVNALDNRHTHAICELLNGPGTDEELKDLYDLFFSQPYLDLTTPNVRGYSPLDLARLCKNRTALTARMEKYLDEHPSK
ncbi:hypothetical protein [Actinomyces trachealis]|uniref:hypothetical protein n=1 Tax=Actinomyces trachealis TaxID=2763540 RepID=UPI001892C548|nr:hypothetical protein [Actinomyces trachealis]